MSGGSFGHLCFKDTGDLFEGREDSEGSNLQNMADELAKLGFVDAAKETQWVLLELRRARNRIDARLERLSDVWKAVEWWKSCDSTREAVDRAVAKYRGEVSW